MMRIIATLLTLVLTLGLSAQNKVGITEVFMTTEKGEQPGFEFFVPDTDAKAVLDAWNKFHKNLKTKPKQDKTQKNYYFSDNALLLELSENTIDIYARIYETNGGVRFTCAFDLGGVFISSDKTIDKFNKTKLILNKFYAQMAMDAIIAEIESELSELEKIKKEFDEIEDALQNFEKEADSYTASIEEQSDEQEKIETELKGKTAELSVKEKELITKKAELKEIDKVGMVASLTTNTNNLKKLDLALNKMERDIESKEAEIATIQADIEILKNNRIDKTQEKKQLEDKIQAIEDKLVSLNIEEKEDKVKLLEQNIDDIEATKTDLNLQNGNTKKVIVQQQTKLKKVKAAINVSKETKILLQKQIEVQETKLKELEDLKATIE